MPAKKVSIHQEAAAVRERLLLSAIDVFTLRGYAAATVREIVQAAGVTKPVLYYYFGSKEGIYLEIMKEAMEALKACLEEAEEAEGSAGERIHDLYRKIYELAREHLKVVRLIHSIFYGPPQGAPPCSAPDASRDLLHEATLHLVGQGIRSGEFARRNNAVMAYALEGAFGLAIELEMASPERSIGNQGLKQVLDVILDGLKGPGISRSS